MPQTASITERLATLGSAPWAVHFDAKRRIAEGEQVILLTIGEADAETTPALLPALMASLRAGRVGYSGGRGEIGLRKALAQRYAKRAGRDVTAQQVISFPGTQAALYAALTAMVEPGDGVLVADPYYATYPGLIAAPGGVIEPVMVGPDTGYGLSAEAIRHAITPKSKVIWLNSPHNPTGTVLSHDTIQAIGQLAIEHDLWILSDEVYEELIFPGQSFVSAFDQAELAERTVVCASISKSHAAAGYRAGWMVGPEKFISAALPLAEMMLFGMPPFIQDAMEAVVSEPSPVAPAMAESFARRAAIMVNTLNACPGLQAQMPQAGMFVVVDISGTGLTGTAFAERLLDETGVAVMPGAAFGAALAQAVRISLTASDDLISEAATRIGQFASHQALSS